MKVVEKSIEIEDWKRALRMMVVLILVCQVLTLPRNNHTSKLVDHLPYLLSYLLLFGLSAPGQVQGAYGSLQREPVGKVVKLSMSTLTMMPLAFTVMASH